MEKESKTILIKRQLKKDLPYIILILFLFTIILIQNGLAQQAVQETIRHCQKHMDAYCICINEGVQNRDPMTNPDYTPPLPSQEELNNYSLLNSTT